MTSRENSNKNSNSEANEARVDETLKTLKEKHLVGGPGPQKSKLLIKILVIVLALALTVTVIVLVVNEYNKSERDESTITEVTNDNIDEIILDLDTRAHSGEVDAVLSDFDKYIETTDDNDLIWELLLQQSSVAMKNEKFDYALGRLSKAAAIKENHRVYTMMSNAHEALGNTDKAIEYYEKSANDDYPGNYGALRSQRKADELKKQ